MKKSILAAIFLTFSLVAISLAQTEKPGAFSSVTAAGTLDRSRYANPYFGLTIDAPNATLTLNPQVNTAGESR
jgi:hypothetical protein